MITLKIIFGLIFFHKILDMMKDPLREEDLSFAREEENKTKNRDSTIIPRKSPE